MADDDAGFDDVFAMMQNHFATPPAKAKVAATVAATRRAAALVVADTAEAGEVPPEIDDVFAMMQSHFAPKPEPKPHAGDKAPPADAAPAKRPREESPPPQQAEPLQNAAQAKRRREGPRVHESIKVTSTGSVASITRSNGHAFKVAGKWYLAEELQQVDSDDLNEAGEVDACDALLAEVAADANTPAGPPPESVIAAYTLLDLPLTSSDHEVARRARLLSRAVHPDKVAAPGSMISIEGREEATARFWNLQEAKTIALAWLGGRADFAIEREARRAAGARDLDSSDESDKGSDAESDQIDDIEERDTMRAVGIDSGDEYDEPKVGLAAGEQDESSEEGASGYNPLAAAERWSIKLADLSGGVVVSQDNTLEQAASLGSHLEALRAAGVEFCQECLERKVPEGQKICTDCKRELTMLSRQLRKPVCC